MTADIASAFLDEVRRSMRGHKRLAEGAVAQVSDDELFHQLDAEANSIAVIMKHISGNQRSRFTDFLTTDGEKPDRHRDTEFEMLARPSREELMRKFRVAIEHKQHVRRVCRHCSAHGAPGRPPYAGRPDLRRGVGRLRPHDHDPGADGQPGAVVIGAGPHPPRVVFPATGPRK